MTKTLSDKEIWIAANQMIQSHKAEAEVKAQLRAKQMQVVGDMDGRRIWLQVVAVIKMLQNTESEGLLN